MEVDMVMRKPAVDNPSHIKSIDIEIDDESVLADGMIADSRIVKLIDELEASNDDSEDTSE